MGVSKSGYDEKFIERFWSNVEVGEPDECWLWRGSLLNAGYGLIKYQDKGLVAHRVSYAIENGEIPPKMIICHRCDVPACVNPAHLFLGTHQDNVRDRVKKGRTNHAVTEEKVLRIFALRQKGLSYTKISEEVGVSRSYVRCVVVGLARKTTLIEADVTTEEHFAQITPGKHQRRDYSPESIELVRSLRASGMYYRDIAKQLGTNTYYVFRILNGNIPNKKKDA